MSLFRNTKNSNSSNGFTLPELVVVVVVIGVLAATVMVVMNPGKRQAIQRDANRAADIVVITTAINQYGVDNKGALPSSLTTTPTEICKTGGNCTGLVDLSTLTANGKFLSSMPRDPKCGDTTTDACDANGTGYRISRTTDGRITVAAPATENGKAISMTK